MKHLFSLLFLVYSIIISGQSISVTEIPTLGKLPVNAIHRIYQDKDGYIWYGTVNGLCRDDGYNVKIFRSDIYTQGLLNDNLVLCIDEDNQGKIWFGTEKGAYMLNKKDYSIIALDSLKLKNKSITRIDSDSYGYMWISIAGVILKYDSYGNFIKEYQLYSENKLSDVKGFCQSRKGKIIITLNSGEIKYYDSNSDLFIAFDYKFENKDLGEIIQDNKDDYFWIATWKNGIVCFNPNAQNKDSVFVSQPIPVNIKGVEDEVILYLVQDDIKNYIWATTSTDLVAFEKDANGILKQVDLSNILSSSNKMLNEIIKDKTGNLWIAAFDQPSFIIHFKNDIPINYSLPELRKRINGNPAIMAMIDNGDGTMWISQERTGLFLYNVITNEQSCFLDFENTKKLPLGAIKIMSETSSKNGAWIVPVNSAKAYKMLRDKMKMNLDYEINIPNENESDIIKAILENNDGNEVIIGTANNVYIYNIENKNIDRIISDIGFVTDLAESKNGDIWISTTDNGIYKIDKNRIVSNYNFLYPFTTIAIGIDGIIWLGSCEGGIYKFNYHDNELLDFSQICGMTGDMVNQVEVDMFNHVWIGTNTKIIEFNPKNHSYNSYLTSEKSMLLWRLIPTSLCRGHNGEIYFGGIPGICSVMPSNRLDYEAERINTIITDIKVKGESLNIDRSNKNRDERYIEIYPEDRNIEISFSSLDYRLAHKIRYAYKLIDIDADWVYTDNGKNIAFYNSLPKGEYEFHVKSTDANGLWSDNITKIKLIRKADYYESWWAYTIYCMLILACSTICISFYHKRIERKNNEMWSDSQEMIKMKHYLNCEVNLNEDEYIQMDKLLLDKAIKIVEEYLTDPEFDVNLLASSMNMSRSTLSRKLKTITGRTPLDFIRNIKMKHACHMLTDKDRNITDVAISLGYLNRKYFTSCFKEEFGITPSEYQKTLN